MDLKKKLSRLRQSSAKTDEAVIDALSPVKSLEAPGLAGHGVAKPPDEVVSVSLQSTPGADISVNFAARAAVRAAEAAVIEMAIPVFAEKLEPEAVSGVVDTSGLDERALSIRSRLMQLAERKAKPKGVTVKAQKIPLPGSVRITDFGEVHIVAEAFAATHVQGNAALSRALGATGELVAKLALDPRLAAIDFRRALFIDTETTGLSHGAGTLPFLIGIAWHDGESLQLEQLVLRKPGEERPMLTLLAQRIAAASCIVSYNGKSFDWPLLRTRYVMNRLPVPEPAAHVDLLHCARRVYKRRLTCVQLTELERQVLGLERVDDVGGAEIPVVYTDFLRSGDASAMTGVLTHNAHDLVSLVALLGVLVDKLESASDADDVRDQLALAELSVRAGDGDRAHAFASTASLGANEVSAPALALMAGVHKKRREYSTAVVALERAVAISDEEAAPRLHLELAKLYERYLRNPSRALEHARAAMFAEPELANAKRIQRLSISASHLMLPLDLDP
ncbi:MAG: ribonuclease H-like domain-containing protein [Clostridia bacterium]|nr:ribonuclease H-like domain-containing protein [Deltaproteobacteria bacterium]